jgi:hypothetical protein
MGEQGARRNNDADLLKVQILADYYQAQFNYRASVVTGVVVGLFLIDIGFLLAKAYVAFVLFLILVLGALFWYTTIISDVYHSDLENIDQLFTRVQNGEPLNSVTELRKEFQSRHKPLLEQLFGRIYPKKAKK